jgi:hypothetical protein
VEADAQRAVPDNEIVDDERQLLLRAMELLPVLRSTAPAGLTGVSTGSRRKL